MALGMDLQIAARSLLQHRRRTAFLGVALVAVTSLLVLLQALEGAFVLRLRLRVAGLLPQLRRACVGLALVQGVEAPLQVLVGGAAVVVVAVAFGAKVLDDITVCEVPVGSKGHFAMGNSAVPESTVSGSLRLRSDALWFGV